MFRPHASLEYERASAIGRLAKAFHAALRSGRGGMNASQQPAESN